MLSDRQKLILKAIIEEYIDTGEPVGSKALTDRPYLDFSSATIRYDMQHLEESGYLEKTHTSSGRIPSEIGFRFYVDNLITRDEDVQKYYERIDEVVDNLDLPKEKATKKLIDLLAEITGYYAVVFGSSSDFSKIKKMEIVPLGKNDAVLLIVTSSGDVQKQRITIPEGFNMDDMLKLIEMFDNAMYDRSIYEIREVLSKEASKPRIRQMVDFKDDILYFMIIAFARFLNNEVYSTGLSRLFNLPEFQEHKTMQKIIKVLDDDNLEAVICTPEKGLNIRIGTENQAFSLEKCSIITIPYYIDDNEYGKLALVGPVRMQYKMVIPLLEYIAKSIPKLYSRGD